MSITTAQIRGARGILNWSQQDLAQRTGISATSIGAIENGQTSPRNSTIDTIKNTFERNGIEFLGLQGIRERDNTLQNYEGTAGIQSFFDDVYLTAKEQGGQICLFNGVPVKLLDWLGNDFYLMHKERMSQIKDNYDFKIIIEEGDDHYIANNFASYRWFPKNRFNEKTLYCYGDKLAFLDFKKDNVTILVMQQADIASSFRELFEIAWNNVAYEPQIEKAQG